MAARIDQVCDEIGTRIAAQWATDPGVPPLTVFVDESWDIPEGGPSGLVCFVADAGWTQAEQVTRDEDSWTYRVVVAVVDRYRGLEAVPPREWVRDRKGWVERLIVRPLNDARSPPILGSVRPTAAPEVISPDLEARMIHGLFDVEILFTFGEDRLSDEVGI